MEQKEIKLMRPRLRRAEWNRRSQEFLKRVQDEHPGQESDVVAINMETGEYVLASDPDDAAEAFWEKWPDVLMQLCRVDGGAVDKFHGI